MYCPECDEEGIDFNSVAVTNARPSYTGEIGDTGVYGTAHTSETNVVNICKECGCDNLHRSKRAYLIDAAEVAEEEATAQKEKNFLIYLGLLAALLAGAAIISPTLIDWWTRR